MSQRWLTWVVALLLIAGVTTVAAVFLLQGDGPPEYVTAFGEQGKEAGKFDQPAGVAVDSSGNVYVLDTGNNRIQRFDPEGNRIDDWGGPGSDQKLFRNPLRIAINAEGIVWIADTDNHRLQSFDSKGRFLSEVGSLGNEPGQFSHPIGIAFDPAGNVWVADSGNNRIQKFGPGMKNVLAIIPEDAKPSNAKGEFDTPWGLACDATGNVYVADTKNNRIQRFLKDGTYVDSWGAYGDKPKEFKQPTGILIDRQGNLFVVDSGNNRIQKFDSQGKYICEWGQAGTNAREFNDPQQITQGPDGTIYIADTRNNRIQKYRPRKQNFFQADAPMQIPIKPQAPGPSETPLDMPEVPTDDSATPGAVESPAEEVSPVAPEESGTPTMITPTAEPTRF